MDELQKLSYITTCKDFPFKDVNNSRLQINKSLRQTTFSIIKESVTSLFNKLQTARHADSTWILKIIINMPIPLFFKPSAPINNTHQYY